MEGENGKKKRFDRDFKISAVKEEAIAGWLAVMNGKARHRHARKVEVLV